MSSPLQDVSDTAFWIAYHRSLESARPDALFNDPFATRLAGERGKSISAKMPTSQVVAWTVALRTRIIDDYIAASLQNGVDAVLNLGAGLDTRPYRMALPEALKWIEADYERIIDYKSDQLARDRPRCRLERVRMDLANRLARRELFARIDAASRSILVLTEGVIPYLSNEAVAALIADVNEMQHAHRWIIDYFSPEALAVRRQRDLNRHMGNAPFRFMPAEWLGFFAQRGWSVSQRREFFDEARRLRRPMPLSLGRRLLWRFSYLFMSAKRRARRRTFAGYALLERTEEQPAPTPRRMAAA